MQGAAVALALLDQAEVDALAPPGLADAAVELLTAVEIVKPVVLAVGVFQGHAFTRQEAAAAHLEGVDGQGAVQAVDKGQLLAQGLEAGMERAAPAGAKLAVIEFVDAGAVVAGPFDVDQPRYAEVGVPQVLVTHHIVHRVGTGGGGAMQRAHAAGRSGAWLGFVAGGLAIVCRQVVDRTLPGDGGALVIDVPTLRRPAASRLGQVAYHRQQALEPGVDHGPGHPAELAEEGDEALTVVTKGLEQAVKGNEYDTLAFLEKVPPLGVIVDQFELCGGIDRVVDELGEFADDGVNFAQQLRFLFLELGFEFCQKIHRRTAGHVDQNLSGDVDAFTAGKRLYAFADPRTCRAGGVAEGGHQTDGVDHQHRPEPDVLVVRRAVCVVAIEVNHVAGDVADGHDVTDHRQHVGGLDDHVEYRDGSLLHVHHDHGFRGLAFAVGLGGDHPAMVECLFQRIVVQTWNDVVAPACSRGHAKFPSLCPHKRAPSLMHSVRY